MKRIKLISLMITFVLMVMVLIGCSIQKLERVAVTDDEFFNDGMALIKEAVDNVEIESYKINRNSGFLEKYKNADLSDVQQAYYTIMIEVVENYNLFKETGDAKYIRKFGDKIEETTKLFKANTKE